MKGFQPRDLFEYIGVLMHQRDSGLRVRRARKQPEAAAETLRESEIRMKKGRHK